MSRNIFRCEACFEMESQCFNNLLCNKVRFTAWEKWTPNSWCMQTLYMRKVISHAQGHSGIICSICALNQSIMQQASTVTYSLIQGNSWNTSGPNTKHSQIFVVPSQRKVHNRSHILYNTKQSSLPVNVKVYNTGKNVYLFHD